MKVNYGFLPLCAAFLAAPCMAQTAPAAVQPMTTAQAVAVLDAPAPASVLRAGTEVRNKGMWGKSGYIGARVLSLRLGDRHVRLTGTFDDKGVTGTGGVIAAVALIPVAGFFTTGTSAMIPLGAAVKGFLDEDVPFRTAAAPVQPIEAPAMGSQLTPSP